MLLKFYHIGDLHKKVIRPQLKFFGITYKRQNIVLYLIYVGAGKSLLEFYDKRLTVDFFVVKLSHTLGKMLKI